MSKSYEIEGKILLIHDTQTFASGFQKREFVVETSEEKYPQQIKLEAVKDGCAVLDEYEIGDEVSVSFNLRGNEYNGKHYVNLQAWKISREGAAPPTRSKTAPPDRERQKVPPAPPVDDFDDVDDDIPF